jgi:hypothetical protein
MASTFSPSLRIELIGDGDQSGIWGQTTNTNLGTLIEQAIAGVVTITMTDTNYTLSNFNGVSDEARNQVIVATGTNNTQRNIIIPLVEKTYTIKNSTTGGFGVQIIGSSGTGVVVLNGVTTTVYCDGSNVYSALNGVTGDFSVPGNTTLFSALNYGGVTLANSVTGTGSMALSASPTFTGTPLAPTPSVSTDNTQIATTAFVRDIIPQGVILMWAGSIASIPSGWVLCDGTNSTPNLRNLFVVGAGGTYAVGATGGTADSTLVSHTHNATSTDSGHTHALEVFNAGTYGAGAGVNVARFGGATSTQSGNANITTTIASAGSSGTGTNLPPYYALAFIMKS